MAIGAKNILVKEGKLMSWASFIIACVIYLLGYAVVTGGTAGANDVLTWYAILIVFFLWGAVDLVLKKIFGKSDDPG